MTGLGSDFNKILSIRVPKYIIRLFFPFRIIIGVCLILFGIVGIILPGLPGWTPLILGVMIISPKHGKLIARWVYSIYKRYIVKFLSRLRLKNE